MLELLGTYRRLALLGLKLGTFSPVVETTRSDEAEKQKLLRRACDLGEQREELLLAHRDWTALDEGLPGYANDMKRRQWHTAVRNALGITQPSSVSKDRLNPPAT